jgi:hypothetical protein
VPAAQQVGVGQQVDAEVGGERVAQDPGGEVEVSGGERPHLQVHGRQDRLPAGPSGAAT